MKAMYKVFIADTSEDWREQLERKLGAEYQIRASGDGHQVLRMLSDFQPDVLVLDLMLQGTDGLSVLKVLHDGGCLPRIIVTGRYFSNFVTGALERYQVDELIMKPCTTQSVADHIAEVLSQDREEVPVCPDPFDYVTALLVRMGAPTSQQGFRFLRRGVMLMMADPCQQLTKSLYPALAAEFGTSATNVEKSLRTTVTTAWTRRRDDVWRNYFPTTSSGQVPKPTTGQFLSRMADAAASATRARA
jgi:two-component system response regulator (stage 0 sporulation protein A)